LSNFGDIRSSDPIHEVVTAYSSRPMSPTTGQEIVYAPTTLGENGQPPYWLLRYDGTYWRCIGGVPVYDLVTAAESTTSGTATNLTTDGPSLTIDWPGIYRHGFGCRTYCSSATKAAMIAGLHINAVLTDNYDIWNTGVGAFTVLSPWLEGECSVSTSGHVAKLMYWTSSSISVVFQNRRLTMVPLRLNA